MYPFLVLCVALAGVQGVAVGGAASSGSQGPAFGVAEDAPVFASDAGASVYADLNDLGMPENRLDVLWEGSVAIPNPRALPRRLLQRRRQGSRS